MPRRKASDLSHLPAKEVERGKAFAELLRAALYKADMNQAELAEATGLRPGTISVLYNDGYDKQLDKIRQPGPETIAKIATATGANEDEMRHAAGYSMLRPVTTALGTEIPKGFDVSELERFLPEDQRQLLRFYRGVPPEDRPAVVSGMKTAADIAREIREANTYGNRDDRETNPAKPPERGDAPGDDER